RNSTRSGGMAGIYGMSIETHVIPGDRRLIWRPHPSWPRLTDPSPAVGTGSAPILPGEMARSSRMGANLGEIGRPSPISSWWPEGRHPRLTPVSTPPGMDGGPSPAMTLRGQCHLKFAPMRSNRAMTPGDGQHQRRLVLFKDRDHGR